MESLLVEFLFPRFCVGCGYLGTYVCSTCEKRMGRVGGRSCYYCGRPSLLGLTHPGCRRTRGIDGTLSIYRYDGLFKKILHESKYKGAITILNTLLKSCGAYPWSEVIAWKRMFDPHIMSVPLHANRIRQRGFNQSDSISTLFAQMAMLKTSSCLTRIHDTPHLAMSSDKKTRRNQVRQAFRVSQTPLPHAIILVDDVITTGATISECARELKKNGVQIVLTISLAKG